MIEYVTIDYIDNSLGQTWADDDKKARAVMLANIWLNAKPICEVDPIPKDLSDAGVELAREAANDNLFKETEVGVQSYTDRIDGAVSEAKSYFQGGGYVLTIGEQVASNLITRYLCHVPRFKNTPLKRI